MKYRYPLSSAFQFGWPGIKGFAFNSRDDFERASAAIFEVTDRHGLVKNVISDRIYYVLDGSGEFIISGQRIAVSKEDVIIVPKGTEYDYAGRLRLFLVHSPAYDPESDVDIEGVQGKSPT